MKQVKTYLGFFFIIAGIIMMAGSAGDCDGHCGPGNTIGEMLMIAFMGLCLFGTGAWIAISSEK
jgi:vacuolar-type H+-ATPase subunit I/STV1